MARADEQTHATRSDDNGKQGRVHEEKITFSYPEWMDELVESQLSYGDSKSAWLREAIRQRLRREGLLEN